MLRWFVGAISLVLFADATPAQHPTDPPTPILVELFTSEGCSSCPPADDVVARLSSAQPVPGARVIVLAHHVDYWDSLGWADPWSSPAATARERNYGRGTYTPHAFIDGDVDMVGSRGAAIDAAVADATKRTHIPIAIDLSTTARDTYDVTVRATPPADSDVVIAVIQDRGKVAVSRGENAGKTLAHVGIVRSLVVASKAHIALPPPVAAPDGTTFSIVAFIQDRTSHRVLGSAVRPCQ